MVYSHSSDHVLSRPCALCHDIVLIASKYTDLPVFLLKSDYKYWQKFENTENLENWHNTSCIELEAKW